MLEDTNVEQSDRVEELTMLMSCLYKAVKQAGGCSCCAVSCGCELFLGVLPSQKNEGGAAGEGFLC